jgi:hypothetical protein
MSAELAVRGAVLAALNGDPTLGALVNGVYDGPPVKASEPHVVVGECAGSEWGTKDAAGREVRVSVSLYDRQEASARLAQMTARADALILNLSGASADGWRIATVVLIRSRTARARDRGWACVVDYRLRALAAP